METARRDARLEGEEQVDASDSDSVAAALGGAAVCVNCVAYRLNLAVMRGCLAAGVHYVDLGGLFHVTREQLELDEDFRGAGLTAILGLGSAPGKSNLRCRTVLGRRGIRLSAADRARSGHLHAPLGAGDPARRLPDAPGRRASGSA